MNEFKRVGAGRYVYLADDGALLASIIDKGKVVRYRAKREDGTTVTRRIGRWRCFTRSGSIGWGADTLAAAKVAVLQHYGKDEA